MPPFTEPAPSQTATGGHPWDGVPGAPRRLDDLLDLGPAALARLYAEARCPDLELVRGDLRGRMLAIPAVRWPLSAAIRRFAGSSVFPWKGKSFHSLGVGRGEGVNRVLGDRFRWYRFTTFVDRSRAGAFDAVQLDYDHLENPFFIRAIKDEIREIRPGLYLGQAYVQALGKATLALYFALER